MLASTDQPILEDWVAMLVDQTVAGRYPSEIIDQLPQPDSEEIQRRARSDLQRLGRWASLYEAGSMTEYDLDPLVREMVKQYALTLRVRERLQSLDPKRRY